MHRRILARIDDILVHHRHIDPAVLQEDQYRPGCSIRTPDHYGQRPYRRRLLLRYELALADVADFEELKSKKDEYTFEEIESKCAIMFARKNIDVKLNNSNKGTAKARLVFEADEGDKDFVQTKYGKIYKNIHK